MAPDMDLLKSALAEHRERLLKRQQVVATGIGFKTTADGRTADLSIVCSVTKKETLAKLRGSDIVPKNVDGVPTDVVETGVIRAQQPPTGRFRPAPGGVSIGHIGITAGTLGCLVRKGDQRLVLSNNHVLANSNDAQPGDAILQPGPFDGGKFPQDHFAELEQFVPIVFEGQQSDCGFANSIIEFLNFGCRLIGSQTRYGAYNTQATDNLVDAALGRPLNPDDVTDDILEIGPIQGTARGELGMALKKSGRTTGFTTGEIQQVDVTASVQYGPGQIARFTDQLLAGAMSQGGDSGSAVLNDENRLVGLLFAGSENTTIVNRIEHVFSALGVTL
jgi:hypothetical protein